MLSLSLSLKSPFQFFLKKVRFISRGFLFFFFQVFFVLFLFFFRLCWVVWWWWPGGEAEALILDSSTEE